MIFIEFAVAVIMVTFIGQSMIILLNGMITKDIKTISIISMVCAVIMLITGIIWSLIHGISFSVILNVFYPKFTWMIIFIIGILVETIYGNHIVKRI